MNLQPYLSRTPPPLNNDEDDNVDEEFGTFVVSSDLGEEVYEVFDKASNTLKSEDNVSEDSGFCMNSCGQTQSPCDISPLSSSYPTKGNEDGCVNEDVSETGEIDCHASEKNSTTTEESAFNEVPVTINSLPESDIKIYPPEEVQEFDKINDLSCSNELLSCSYIDVENVNFISKTSSENSLHVLENEDCKPELENSFINSSDLCESVVDINEIDESKLNYFSENLSFNIARDEPVETETLDNNVFTDPSNQVENCLDIAEVLPDTVGDISHAATVHQEEGSINPSKSNVISQWGSDEDFSDFVEFQSSSEVKDTAEEPIPDFDSQFADQLISEESVDVSITTLQSAVQTSVVWNCMECFEETAACKYQWATSCTNMKFLQALQIDSRNIFYGPWSKINKLYWNDVPSHCDTSFNSHFPDSSRSTSTIAQPESSIPEAHFDWVSSGLINPLQPVGYKYFTTDVPENTISEGSNEVLNSKKNKHLASLPSLNFVKIQYIVFKRD